MHTYPLDASAEGPKANMNIDDDVKEIKEILLAIKGRLDEVEEFFSSEDEFSSINQIHDKLNVLVRNEDRRNEVRLAELTLDKFEDYMKNVDKLSLMINEFKGCVSMSRGALSERKDSMAEFASLLSEMQKERHAEARRVDRLCKKLVELVKDSMSPSKL